MYGVEGIVQTFQTYAGSTLFLALFLICLLFCYCTGEDIARKRIAIISVLSVLVVFNNISMKIVGKITSLSTYYRFIWALPVIPVIAYVAARVITERKKWMDKAVVTAVVFLVFWGWKSSFITEGSFQLPGNKYNLPNDTVAVCDIIKEDKSKECPVVIFDMEMQLSARTYDASLIWGISRNAYMNHNDMEGYENAGKYRNEKIMIHAVNYGVQGESKKLSRALAKKEVDYIVTFTSFGMDAYFDSIGYELIGIGGDRSVYAKKSD